MDDGNTFWLQDSMKPIDPIPNDDVEAELRLMAGNPSANSAANPPQHSSAARQRGGGGAYDTTHGSSFGSASGGGIPTLRDPRYGGVGTSRAELGDLAGASGASTPRGTPASSQPMPRGGRTSIASADYHLQTVLKSVQSDVETLKTELQDSQEEVAMLTKVNAAEKKSVDTWKARYSEEQRRAAAEVDDAHARTHAAKAAEAEARDAAARVEKDFAAYRRDAAAEVSAAAKEATAAVREAEVAPLEQRLASLEVMMKETEHQAEQGEAAQAALSQLRETAAFAEEELRIARDELEQQRSAFEAARIEAEAAARNALASEREAHAAECRRIARESAETVDALQREMAEAASTARQRVSQGDEAREALRRAEAAVRDLQDELEARQAEAERARESVSQMRRRLEDEHSAALAAQRDDHEAAVAALIEEHNAERATLKQRLSSGEAASDRAARLESGLAAERERADLLAADVDRARCEADELRRTLVRRDDALAEKTSEAAEHEARAMRIEDDLKAELAAERQKLHDRIEQLLGQIETAARDHALEEESFGEQLADARRRQTEAENAATQLRSGAAKERRALMEAESDARREASDAVAERDDALRAKRHADEKLAAALDDLAAIDRRLGDTESQRHDAARRQKAAARDASGARAEADALQQRLESAETAAATERHERRCAEEQRQQAEERVAELEAALAAAESKNAEAGAMPPPQPRHLAAHQQIEEQQQQTASRVPSASPAPMNPFSQQQQHNALADLEPVGLRKQQYATARSHHVDASVPMEGATHGFAPSQGGSKRHAMPLSPSASHHNQMQPDGGKRHRSEEGTSTEQRRLFMATGFDASQNVLGPVASLPNADVVAAAANSAVPGTVTHLVTSGQMTVKLLTALVKGAWVLPEAYLTASLRQGEWENEAAYGFRHRRMILKGRSFLFTDAFKGSRHFATAKLVATEGGADVRTDLTPADAADMPRAVVLVTPQEHRAMRQAMDGKPAEVMSWDSMVKTIYPPSAVANVTRAATA